MNPVPLSETRRHWAAVLIVFMLTAALAIAAIWHSEQTQLLLKAALGLSFSLLLAALTRLLLKTRAQARALTALIEERTVQSEERFRRLLDEVPAVAVQGYLMDGTTCYWNRASERIYGYAAQEAIGRSLLDLIIPLDMRDTVRGAIAMMAETGQPIPPAELSLQRKDGTRVAVYSSHAVVRISGRAPEFFCVDIDLTEPRRVQDALAETMVKYRTLFDDFPLGITITDAAGRIVEANAASERLLGVSRAEHGTRSIDAPQWRILRPDGQPMPAEEFASVRALKEQRLVEGVESGIVKAADEITWLTVTAAPLPLPGYGVVVAYGDITAQKTAERALRESEERYRQIVEAANEGIWIIDRQGITTFANRQMETLLGCPPGGLSGRSFFDFMDAAGRGEAEQRLAQRNEGVAAQHEFRFIRADGTAIWTLITTTPLRAPDGQVVQALAMVTDITERKRSEEAIRRLALFDALTGLPNRRLLLDRLGQALAAVARTRRLGALMFIDLDNFKALNDRCGHDLGDRLLQQAAARLTATVRRRDSVARLGGDEFVVLLEDLSADPELAAAQVREVGGKLLAAFVPPFDLEGELHRGTCSIGISLFTGSEEESAERLLKRADQAMYRAKAAGRNTLCLA
ncbi:MAG: PAS domain S-box protein [Lamprocystis purpurea]|uniref:sensor domain-containing protein n=1 Tax=Lamprocystis purpurea TaxID=61598 RepID=UPI0003622F3D|nr:PAS domain S-box protein [Lamprocystis purpurea]MBV5272597.1 PAS domain S-box protein [Lamprocystis purpurea]